MDREVFFDWLDSVVLSDDNRDLWWSVTEDDGTGCITVKFHNVEEEDTEWYWSDCN